MRSFIERVTFASLIALFVFLMIIRRPHVRLDGAPEKRP